MKELKLKRNNRSRSSLLKKYPKAPFILMALFVVVFGVGLLYITQAAITSVSVEPELSLNRTDVSVQVDSQASNGSYVSFGSNQASNLIFADEFNGTAVNTANWRAYYNTYGDGNNEEACLTPNNAVVSNGTLKIIANREQITCPGQPVDSFSSAFLSSRDAGKYYPKFAKYEIRAKLPHAQGLWPAFWLRHKNGSAIAEVDIMEYFHAQVPGKSSATIHLDRIINIAKKTTDFEPPTVSPGWHTWAVEMTPVSVGSQDVKFNFLLDGQSYFTYTPTQQDWAKAVDSNQMFDIAINMAVGGNNIGHPDDELGWSRYLNMCLKPYRGSQPCNGSGIMRASFPAVYEIDYVRVHKL
jgi:hypothetical protein